MSRLTRVLPTVLMALALLFAAGGLAVVADASTPVGSGGAASTAKRTVPSRDQWLADVKTAMKGSRGYVRQRVAAATDGERLAVNFDIDNTVLATYYDGGGPIPQQLRFARFLQRQHVALVFNTGRSADQKRSTRAQLKRNGFPVDDLCLRNKGETLPDGKQRCRDAFAASGWTLIANVGNNDTDFVGDGYEGQAYVLPNYGGALG